MASLHQAVELCDVEKIEELLSSENYRVNSTDSEGRAPLHLACGKGYLDKIRVLVRYGANLNEDTPLTLAAKNIKFYCIFAIKGFQGLLHFAYTDANIVLVLVQDCKADLNIRDNFNDTPLMTAAINEQYYELVKSLVYDYGCNPNARDSSGDSLLHLCADGCIDLVHVLAQDCKAGLIIRDDLNNVPLIAAAKNKYVVKTLVCNYGCDHPNVRKLNGESLLRSVCDDGHIDILVQDYKAHLSKLNTSAANEILKSLVYDYGCDPNVKGSSGKSLLHIACADGHTELVHVKADLNIRDSLNSTPLMIATENKQYEVVKSLVWDSGCNPNVNGESLHLNSMCVDGHIDLVHVLMQDYKANLNIIDNHDNTPLMTAAKNKQYGVVKSLVCDYGCDPNVKDLNGESLLHLACAYGHTELVHVLVRDCKADLNIRDNFNSTPLMIATKHEQYEVVKSLVCDYGCDPPDVRNSNGDSLLHIACAHGHIELVHVLVQDYKADLNIIDNHNNTPLMTAAKNKQYRVLKSLVCEYGCDPNVKGSNGKSLLHIACVDGHTELVHVLVRDCKADLNTPLIKAAKHMEYEVVKTLVHEYGCDPNVRGSNGESLLHFVCADGHIDLVHILVRDCMADLNIKDDHDYTPFMTAVYYKQYEVWESLVCDYGCDPNITNSNGESLLHFACAFGKINLVHVLVQECKADFNIRDDCYDTPLMTAVKVGEQEVVKLLISDYKCDVNVTDNKGRSLLHVTDNAEMLKLLVEQFDMSPLLVDNEGNTPLHLFSSIDYNFECAQVLINELHAPLYIHNKEGKTPKDLARDLPLQSLFNKYLSEHGKEIQADYKSMQLLATKIYSGFNHITRLFVLGHPGAGKSSLVETLKREGLLKSFSRVSEKLVPPHTAGIVPSIYISESYGRIQFYDFAGDPEYYSSHAAILERLFQSNIGTNICIIVLNLLEDDVEIKKKYLFWHSFINYSFKGLEESPSVLVIGSHSDNLPNKKAVSRKESYIQDLNSTYNKKCVYLSLDCCSPRSNNISILRQRLHEIAIRSQLYGLSFEESIMLGLLEKDFSNVTACTAKTIACHIKELNLSLPKSVPRLYPILQQLQAIGLLLLVGGKEEDCCYIVLNVAQLTNEVHKKLFSKDAFSINPSLASFNIGLLPESLLQEVLPKYITKECLIQLQYCQEVSHLEIGSDHSISPSLRGPDNSTSLDKSYLFFPALCSLDKKDISWQTPPEHSYSIGWLARCHDLHNYFPPRFLHVLLLRIAFRFTLIVPSCVEGKVSPEHKPLKRRCKMWKTGVHWLSEEGVECEVDVINSKEVVVSLQSIKESKTCISVFNSIVSCVMEAKSEFCDFIVLDCFLLDKVSCLTDDNLFSVEDVERVLRESKPSVLSMNGKKLLSSSKLIHISSSSFWSCLFPIDEHSVLKYINIETIGEKWIPLGLNLDFSFNVLKVIEANHPKDIEGSLNEMVSKWLSSLFSHPPCWWSLVKALRETEKMACADDIIKDKGSHIALQKKLIDSQGSHLTPDEEFLQSFAGVVGSKWPYLASLLSLTSSTIEEVRREGEGLTQRERALSMLHKWVSKEEATYSQLYQKLKPVSLFQYH